VEIAAGPRACYRASVASSILASSLAALSVLAGAPPPAPALVESVAALAPAEDGYAAALAAIDEANIAVNKDPEANLATLEAALEDLLAFGPQIAADDKGREALDLSQLNLARALLLADNEARAAEVMDAVLLTARDRKLPIKRFGPTLVKFHDARRAALDELGSGSIQVQCRVACEIVIDEQRSTSDSGPLYLGAHRVWVEASDGSAPPLQTKVVLEQEGVSVPLVYPEVAEDEPACEPVPIVTQPPVEADKPPKRVLPRWASISVALIGAGAAVAGGVMLGLDGTCPGGLDPVADAQDCPELYEGTVPGLVAIGIGSALTLTGSVIIAVDEVRVGKQRGRQATIGWQMRF